jgi:hypothetical protein
MKKIFFIISLFVIITLFLNAQFIEGITNIPIASRQLRTSSSPIKNIGIRSVTGNISRVSTPADYTHNMPTTTSWNSHTQQWNN